MYENIPKEKGPYAICEGPDQFVHLLVFPIEIILVLLLFLHQIIRETG